MSMTSIGTLWPIYILVYIAMVGIFWAWLMDSQIPISGRQSPTLPAWLSVTERNDQMSTVSHISLLFRKTSHHSVHYSFTALKLSPSWIPRCPLRLVDGIKMAWPHTAEIFVLNLCRITVSLWHERERGDDWGTCKHWGALFLSKVTESVNGLGEKGSFGNADEFCFGMEGSMC